MANYNKLAKLQAKHDDLALFRAFSTLSMKNIQCLQAELLHLECSLEILEDVDKEAREKDRKLYHESFYNLKNSGDGVANPQWQMRLEIRQKLQQYCMLDKR